MIYSKLFKNFANQHILVIGDPILDHYVWGTVERISPEAPVPVVDVKSESFTLGGAANVAANIAALGGKAAIVGVKGKDVGGEVLDSLLRERGIDTTGLFTGKRPTTVKTRVIAHNQQVVRFDREERRTLHDNRLKDIRDYLLRTKDRWNAVIISDYRKGVISETLMDFIRKEFKKKGCFVSVDPKVGHFHLYKNVSLITPNTKEASEGSGIDIKDEDSLIRAGKFLLKKLGCDSVLITRGEQGMSLFHGSSAVHIPTVAKSVYDVTGAGDTVIAAFSIAHASGASLEDSANIANHAAGIVVGQLGTATAAVAEIIHSFKRNN